MSGFRAVISGFHMCICGEKHLDTLHGIYLNVCEDEKCQTHIGVSCTWCLRIDFLLKEIQFKDIISWYIFGFLGVIQWNVMIEIKSNSIWSHW